MPAAVKNAADREQVKKAKATEVTQRESELNDFKQVISAPAGRRFVARYLRRTGVFEDTYSENHSYGSRLDGMRWVGLQLLQDVKEADPTVLLEALQNYMDEEKDGRRTDKRKSRRKPRTRGNRNITG